MKQKENLPAEDKKATGFKDPKAMEQDGKSKKSIKDDGTDDPQFQEFLEVMQHRSKSKLWANDTVAAVSREKSGLVPDDNYKTEKGEEYEFDGDLEESEGEIDAASKKIDKAQTLAHDEAVSDMDYFKSRIKKNWSDSESSDTEGSTDGTDNSDNDESAACKVKRKCDPVEKTIETDVFAGEAENGFSKESKNGSDEPSSSPKNDNAEVLESTRLFIRNLPYTATYVPCYLVIYYTFHFYFFCHVHLRLHFVITQRGGTRKSLQQVWCCISSPYSY